MSNDFSLVDPAGWEWDVHGIYSAYLGYFQSYNIAWYDRSWGHFFSSFDAFLGFNWPTIVITDARTGRGHIVTRASSIHAFVRMIKTRFGESMPNANDNMTPIISYEHNQRQLRHISDVSLYKKIHATLPAATLAALRSRVKHGNPKEIQRLWQKREMTFLSLDFEWSEKSLVVLEMGYATIRSAHLEASGVWPPTPDSNYRKGHYIVQDYVDKIHNRLQPTFPWDYAWGESQLISKTKLPDVINALITSLASPDSESIANNLVLVTHTPHHILERLQELKVKLPSNVLVIDIAHLEKQIFASRNNTPPSSAAPTPQNMFASMRNPSQLLPLPMLITSLNIPVLCPWNNSGNDAFYTLVAFQYLIDPEGTRLPQPKVAKKDGMPMVAAATPNPAMYASMSMPMMAGTGRMSMSNDDFGWQARMSMMNGSMPSLFTSQAQAPAQGQGSGRGRPAAANGNTGKGDGAGDRRSGSMPRGTANDSGSTRNRPNLRAPHSGSSSGHSNHQPNSQSQASLHAAMHRRQESSDDFQPPQAPFAREAMGSRRARNSSYSDESGRGRSSPFPMTNRSGSAPNTPTGGLSPSITVTNVASDGRGSSKNSTREGKGTSSNESTTISLNEPPKEKRPQSDLLPVAQSGNGRGGGFLSSFKRLSMKP